MPRQPTILIQNYHSPATTALIRDFAKIGFKVFCPDSNWDRISYFADNTGLGGTLISHADYMALEPSYLLIACIPQEADMKAIARAHNDQIILNIAQHWHSYEAGISEVMICPDIITYENYPSDVKHKLLYFPMPYMSAAPSKDIQRCFEERIVCSYISMPQWWPEGTALLEQFKSTYPGELLRFGYECADGPLTHLACNRRMASSFFTIHFKEQEAYGLSCLESMMLGTPVVGLRRLMHNKTLGRFFLRDDNSIMGDSVEEIQLRIASLSLDDYSSMSAKAKCTVLELTSDEATVDRLKSAIMGDVSDDRFHLIKRLPEQENDPRYRNFLEGRTEFGYLSRYEHRLVFAQACALLVPDIICDIGSFDGRDAQRFAEANPQSTIISFEANPENFFEHALSERMLGSRVCVQHLAISDSDGVTEIIVPGAPPNASDHVKLLMRGMGSILRRPDIPESRSYMVAMRRLDSFFKTFQPSRSFALWIDVEGHTKSVLSGAQSVLAQTVLVKLELETAEYWAGQALAPEIIVFMKAAGFDLIVTSDPAVKQFDALFLREGKDKAALIEIINRVRTG